jgi:hypothetical protein
MLSKSLCGVIFASAAAGATAQTWNFTYTGFTTYYGQPTARVFDPNVTISGSFSGTDRNGDGTLSTPELSSFLIQSLGIKGKDFTRCAQDATPNNMCSLDAFSFSPQGNLAFTVKWNRPLGNEGGFGYNGGIESGVRESFNTYDRGDSFYAEWAWDPRTTLTISPAPVPEPPPAALALTGLLTLGLAGLPSARRRAAGHRDGQRRSTC